MIITEHSSMELGQALAYIRNVLNFSGDELEGLSAQQRTYITNVHHRFVELSSNRQDDVYTKIPHCSCPSDKPFLTENMDFFISFLLIGIDEADEKSHAKLTKHLNDCFWCFELFTDVVRDYFHASQKFIN